MLKKFHADNAMHAHDFGLMDVIDGAPNRYLNKQVSSRTMDK